jgi:type III secretory pathway lipoprotein EscJ
MNDWVTAYKDKQEYRVEIVKAVLADHNIQAVVITNKDASYHFGEVELRVQQEDVLNAIKIIEDDIHFE